MNAHFTIEDTPLPDLKVVARKVTADNRGSFERLFCDEELAVVLENRRILQINRTLTLRRGSVRGMHYQRPPHAEMKFVSCIRGEILDVAVDLRAGSKTFLRSHSEVLSCANVRMMVIPEGFAHGFQALTDDCELIYLHTARYDPRSEGGLHPLDPALGIKWPLEITEISQRDTAHEMIGANYRGVDQ